MTKQPASNRSGAKGADPLFQAHRRFWAGFAIFIITFYILAVTAPDPGLTWDEAIYIGFAGGYLDWVTNPESTFRWQRLRRLPEQDPAATPGRRPGQPLLYGPIESHPPLGKAITAASIWGLSHTGVCTDPIMNARLGACICFALANTLLFFFVAGAYGLEAGALAALFFLLMPRVFGHGHLASLEVPVLLTWLLTVVAFEKGTRNALWSVCLGLCFGLALLTRFNTVVLAAFLIPWGLLFRSQRLGPNLVAMAVISPLVFLAGWPAMWHNTMQALHVYLADKFSRQPQPFMFLGRTYPTADYPFVMTLLTVPLPMLAAVLIGTVRIFKPREKRNTEESSRRRDIGFLLLFASIGPLIPLAMPGVPRYDGVRLFLPAFPFLASIASLGALAVWKGLDRAKRPRAALCVPGIALAWLIVPLVLLHPFQLAYYNLLTGGPWGADKLGMETVYWNESLDQRVLDHMAQRLPSGGKVALAGIGSQVDDVLRWAGWWPEGVEMTQFANHDWDMLVVVPRKGWLQEKDKPVWEYRLNHRPARTWYVSPFGKVPACEAYEPRDR